MAEMHKDPVCGMAVFAERALNTNWRAQTIYFCSEFCRQRFLARPESYLAALVRPAQEESKESRQIAYFSMEVAVAASMPTYSGGLGVLAGDTLKSCADLRVPIVGITLLSRKGYFRQMLDEGGNQHEAPVEWVPERFLQHLPVFVEVEIEGRQVRVSAWQHTVIGLTGYQVPLILLDTNVEENTIQDRTLTDYLYGGDQRYRLSQEIVLGVGGIRMLRALGYSKLHKYHMNEGHASLLALELLNSQADKGEPDFERVRHQCIFTTHTPVPAGHDQFSYELVQAVLPQTVPMDVLKMLGGEDRLNMTLLALNLSGHINGVAQRHEQVSREMFPGYSISHITNGVHSWTWTSEEFKALFDGHIPGWSNDPTMLRHVLSIPKDEVWNAHIRAKAHLLELIAERTGQRLAPECLTIGFARRATAYKRADLVFSDINRLLEIVNQRGQLQFVFGGKAHPHDESGKDIIRRLAAFARQLQGRLSVVYLQDYEYDLARLMVAGVDLWLNTPQPPLEASGTSGMKAAHNGVPSLSTLDGWWLEGNVEGLTGWGVGSRSSTSQDADDLYRKLNEVTRIFYYERERWIDVMRHTIALNASYFNSHRMVQQYVTNAYLA